MVKVYETDEQIQNMSFRQGWEFALSLFHSKSLILLSDCERFALVAHLKN